LIKKYISYNPSISILLYNLLYNLNVYLMPYMNVDVIIIYN